MKTFLELFLTPFIKSQNDQTRFQNVRASNFESDYKSLICEKFF